MENRLSTNQFLETSSIRAVTRIESPEVTNIGELAVNDGIR